MKAVAAPLLLVLGALSLGAGALRARGTSGALDRLTATHAEPGPFPKAIRTGARSETLRAPPRRIASLTVTSDEILTRLVEPSRLVAVSRFAADPAISTCAERVPPLAARVIGLDPERVIALEPDLVLVAHYTQESALRILGAARIPVVRLRPVRSFDDVLLNVRLAGAVVGEEARAEGLVRDVLLRLRRVDERVARLARPRVLYVSTGGYTTGAHTLVDEKIRRAGGRNVASEAGLVGDVNASLDLLVALDPDVILVPRWTADGSGPFRELTSAPAWSQARAVKTGRVHVIPAGLLTSESEDAALGVEALAALLHPEGSSS